MFSFSYPAKFTAGSDGRVMVEFVDLARVATDGKDDREAMEEAMDALGSDLSIRLSRREEIPTPSSAKRGQRLVPVPLWLAPKLALYLAMRDQQRQQLRVGPPPGTPRARDPPHARSRTRHQGREDPGRARCPRQADDRRSPRRRVRTPGFRGAVIPLSLSIYQPAFGSSRASRHVGCNRTL